MGNVGNRSSGQRPLGQLIRSGHVRSGHRSVSGTILDPIDPSAITSAVSHYLTNDSPSTVLVYSIFA